MNKSQTVHRLTRQRKVILEKLQKLKSHPTVAELFKMVSKILPQLNLSTVYRNLQFLEKQGLIIKLKSKDKEARYDGSVEQHLHLICQKCNKIIDIYDCQGVTIESEQIKESGFIPNYSELEIMGECRECRKLIN